MRKPSSDFFRRVRNRVLRRRVGFSLPDWVNLVGGLIAIVSAVYNAYAFGIADGSPLSLIVVGFVCALCVCFAAANFIFGYHLHRELLHTNELARQLNTQTNLSKRLFRKQRDIAREFREVAAAFSSYELVAHALVEEIENSSDIDLLQTRFRYETAIHLNRILGSVVGLYSLVSGYPCAACIKIRTYENPDYITTIWRDASSRVLRKGYDQGALGVYPLSENTAFDTILRSKTSDFFGCDNLTGLGSYRNLNTLYHEFYNATAVHAIRRPDAPVSEPDSIIGFICVDNKGGGLHNDFAVQGLGILSYLMYSFLGRASFIHSLLFPEGDLLNALFDVQQV